MSGPTPPRPRTSLAARAADLAAKQRARRKAAAPPPAAPPAEPTPGIVSPPPRTPLFGGRVSGLNVVLAVVAVGAIVMIFVSVLGESGSSRAEASATSSPGASGHASAAAGAGHGASARPNVKPSARATGEVTGTTAQARKNTPLEVRATATRDGAVLARLRYDTKVTVQCWASGSESSGWGGTSAYWDRVRTSDGVSGYVPDVWLETSDEVANLVRPC